jgi:hypothetical protein
MKKCPFVLIMFGALIYTSMDREIIVMDREIIEMDREIVVMERERDN